MTQPAQANGVLKSDLYLSAAKQCQLLESGMSIVELFEMANKAISSFKDEETQRNVGAFLAEALVLGTNEICPQYKQDLLNVIDPANNGTDNLEIIEYQRKVDA